MTTRFLIFALSLASSVSLAGAGSDPYNTLQWNRANYEKQNGKIDRDPWYEWWYYKVVDPRSHRAFYFVYGVVNPWDTEGKNPASRTYVGMGDFSSNQICEEVRPVQDFKAEYEATDIQVGPHFATDGRIQGKINCPDGSAVAWNLRVDPEWNFNAMGWGMFIRDLSNIFWYPAQASAWMSGWIETHGQRIHINEAPAYQDRNWGSSFPKWWVWLVANPRLA